MQTVRYCVIMVLFGWTAAGQLTLPARASELKPETVAGFDRYLQLTEARMDVDDLRDDHFLYIDGLPAERRMNADELIRRGEFYIQQLHTLESGSPIHIPGGLIHHWIGIAFVPHSTLSQTLDVVNNYEKYEQTYKPDVRKSKLLEYDGNKSKIYLQLYEKSLVSVVLNSDFDADLHQLSSTRVELRSLSTRIAEVHAPGGPEERELPVGKDHGYLWRLDNYWRLEEKTDGVYLQVESIALSRTVPAPIAVLVNPIIRNLSKAVIAKLLSDTVRTVTERNAPSESRWRVIEIICSRPIFDAAFSITYSRSGEPSLT